MGGIIKSTCMVFVAIVVATAVVPRSEAAITCGTVVAYLRACIPYVANGGPIDGCCGGVKGLNSAAQTPADRKTVCNCLKSLAGQYSGAALARAAGLPGKCGVSIPYKISPSTDCSKVN